MMDARRFGELVRATAPDLARLWRDTRRSGAGPVAPARIDALVTPFLRSLAGVLARGDPPAAAWAGTAGVLRRDAGDPARFARALDAEWTALGDVLASTATAAGADETTRRFLAEAVAHAHTASERAAGSGPVVVVWCWSAGPYGRAGS